MPKEIAPGNFYGSTRFAPPALAPGKGHLSALKAIRSHPSRVYREFPLQKQAFSFCDEKSGRQCLQVWAYELDGKGRRRFVAASYDTFWKVYSRSIRYDAKLHFYEVIRERRASKLYFDLEYQEQLNTEARPEEMIDALVAACKELSQCNQVRRNGCDIIEMDSTSPTKFSRHLVFEQIAFHDNIQAGDFARRAVELVLEKSPDLMMVRKSDGETVPFVDLGVYTKNRCFRLVGSSKFGKVQRLLPLNAPSAQRVSVSQSFFLHSLVCFVRPDVKLLGTVSPLNNVLSPAKEKRSGSGQNFDRLRSSESSPYPSVDDYVHSIIAPMGGGIYGVTVFSSSETVMYAIKGGYKYCANIGRHHKSNNVILLADLHKGEMYQRCFDPDCRGFRSRPWPLPPHLCSTSYEDSQACVDDELSDDALNAYMDDLESRIYQCPLESASWEGGVDDDALNAMMDNFLLNRRGF